MPAEIAVEGLDFRAAESGSKRPDRRPARFGGLVVEAQDGAGGFGESLGGGDFFFGAGRRTHRRASAGLGASTRGLRLGGTVHQPPRARAEPHQGTRGGEPGDKG